MKQFRILAIGLLTTGLFFSSCSNDDKTPEHIHDHDSIHEVELTVSNADGTNPKTYSFEHGKDFGDKIELEKAKTYKFEITAFEAHKDGGHVNIIKHIIEEKDEHFIVYNTAGLDITLTREDDATTTRKDGNKLGIKTHVTGNKNASGIFMFELKHEPTSVDANANNQFGSATGGSTDVLAKFPMEIK